MKTVSKKDVYEIQDRLVEKWKELLSKYGIDKIDEFPFAIVDASTYTNILLTYHGNQDKYTKMELIDFMEKYNDNDCTAVTFINPYSLHEFDETDPSQEPIIDGIDHFTYIHLDTIYYFIIAFNGDLDLFMEYFEIILSHEIGHCLYERSFIGYKMSAYEHEIDIANKMYEDTKLSDEEINEMSSEDYIIYRHTKIMSEVTANKMVGLTYNDWMKYHNLMWKGDKN